MTWFSRFTTLSGRLDTAYIERHTPPALGVELTTRCAFRCVHCPKGSPSYDRPQGQMAPETLRMLLDQAKRLPLRELSLSNDGDVSSLPTDTLLAYLEMIDAAMPRGVMLTVISNLAGFKEAGMRAITGLQRPVKAVVDLYGVRPETIQRLSRYTRGAELVEKARFFFRLLAERALPTETHVQAFRSELDPAEQREFQNTWRGFIPGLGVHLGKLYPYPGIELSPLAVPRVPDGVERYPCVHPFRTWNVNFDGAVPICCLSYGHGILGNIAERPLAEIWKGERFTEVRRRHLANDLDGLPCIPCDNWWFSERCFFRLRQVRGCLKELRHKLLP